MRLLRLILTLLVRVDDLPCRVRAVIDGVPPDVALRVRSGRLRVPNILIETARPSRRVLANRSEVTQAVEQDSPGYC